MKDTSTNSALPFLQGGGEMGQLIRATDWNATPLGEPSAWPLVLKHMISMMLTSTLPTLICWGHDFTQLYNDPFRPINADKHPKSMGGSARDTYAEIWDTIGPMFADVMQSQSFGFPDFMVQLIRNGKREDCYFDFSYSPIKDETGKVHGVLVICVETTARISAQQNFEQSHREQQSLNQELKKAIAEDAIHQKKLIETDRNLKAVIAQAPVAMAIFRGPDYVVDIVNARALELWDRKLDEVVSKPILQVMTELEGQGIKQLLDDVYINGNSFSAKELPVELKRNGQLETTYIDFIYDPLYDAEGNINGIVTIGFDVTESVLTRREIEDGEAKLTQVINLLPASITVLVGPGFIIERTNPSNLSYWNKTKEQTFGKRLLDVLPELADQPFPGQLKHVLETGETIVVSEGEVNLENPDGTVSTTYVDYSYQPLVDGKGERIGVLVMSDDVTEKVQARWRLEESEAELQSMNEELAASNEELSSTVDQLQASEQQVRSIIDSAPFPIAVYLGREMFIVQANQAMLDVWGKGNDVIGNTYYSLLPELEEQNVYPILDDVYTSGKAYNARNQRIDLTMDGVLTVFYFNYSFTPLLDSDGNVYGVMNTAADVTDLNLAKQQVEQNEENFRNMIAQAPVAMCLLIGPQYKIELANDAMLEIWGKPKESVMGKPVFDALPDASQQGLEQLMDDVYQNGNVFTANEQPVSLIRFGKPDVVYQNFVYQPYKDAEGNVLGILAISVDVTEQVLSRKELERAYEQTSLSKQAAQLGTFDLDIVTGRLDWDKRFRELFEVDPTKPVTFEKYFIPRLHPEDRDRVLAQIARAKDKTISNGDYDVEYRINNLSDQQQRWIRAKGKVYFNDVDQPMRFIGSVLDITDQKLHEMRLQENAEKQSRLAAIVNTSDDMILSKTLQGIITSWNAAAERMFGFSQQEAIGQHISMIIPPERIREEEYIISQVSVGRPVDHFETVRVAKDGREIQLSITVSPIIDAEGRIIGASKIARDITAQVTAQETARRYTERLEIMNMMVKAVSEELDLNKILQKVTDATTELTGAKFGAFFYNNVNDSGESYMLYTLSGAPREAFDKFGMPRNTALFHTTFSGEGVVRIDDVTKDPRYGKSAPHHGMPEGHLPVVSYLAVPVTSRSGKVIGGLFFGHPDVGKFTKEHETLVASIAAQAAIGIDNAKLYEEVIALNDKKDEFIGLASHELKTPLTSISGYLQILARFNTDEKSSKFISKTLQQVNKLTVLVNDLLDVSKIEAGKLQFAIEEFDLRQVVTDAIELTRHTTDKYQIILKTEDEHCIVKADSQRIEQVLTNLLTNAIKYSPGADRVEVYLSCDEHETKVGVRDYGLGIAADKLTSIFSRFYRVDDATPNISGLGIGLYLAHEVIDRHKGKIWAESELGKGSTFWFTLPR